MIPTLIELPVARRHRRTWHRRLWSRTRAWFIRNYHPHVIQRVRERAMIDELAEKAVPYRRDEMRRTILWALGREE